ncbi:putative transcriptional regulator [Rheinheimera pacifica]|uniref:helix-turn-helix domain-containing protein n=1 Tax=Rheinheimera pacifica TaxID=173990 RepID=UPI002167B2A2|nr:helix-turn-helix transcriptional regulator [Rheinheimera pacifica]MCS4309278.1 putative transcriptional regulator [Rheinheimera pacifica]
MTLIEKKSFDDQKRVTLIDISEATGIHRATLSRILHKPGFNTTVDIIDRLCTYFKVPVEQLIEHVPDK